MPALSLVDLCTKACIKNIRVLTDISDIEYWQVKNILARVDSPEQLHEIEENCPQIKGEDAELWHAFISRDIPNWRTKNYKPDDPTKWYEIYCQYKLEQKEEIKRDEEILRNTMMGLNNHKATHVSKVVDLRSLPKLPKDPRMIANNGGVPLKGRGVFKKPEANNLLFTAGSRTKLTNGASVLTRARREAKEISAMGKLSKPTHMLSGNVGQVKRAPAAMATEYKIASQPSVKILTKRRAHPVQSEGNSLEAREQRLRAMQSRPTGSKPGSSAAPSRPNPAGYSDEDDDEDLFGDHSEEKRSTQNRAPSSNSRPAQSSPGLHSSSSRPKQASSSPPAYTSDRPSSSAFAPGSRTGTATPGSAKPIITKRKVEVDVFNRSGKKPRR